MGKTMILKKGGVLEMNLDKEENLSIKRFNCALTKRNEEHLTQNDRCPDCGGRTFMQGRCPICLNCGWSPCE